MRDQEALKQTRSMSALQDASGHFAWLEMMDRRHAPLLIGARRLCVEALT